MRLIHRPLMFFTAIVKNATLVKIEGSGAHFANSIPDRACKIQPGSI
jgi:hypothetical protein